MPHLLDLRQAGFSIWPFDRSGWPKVIEIYPRLFTDRLIKTSRAARDSYLARYVWDERLLANAVRSDDALDAAVSAVVMARHAPDLAVLEQVTRGAAALEGLIWHPAWAAVLP